MAQELSARHDEHCTIDWCCAMESQRGDASVMLLKRCRCAEVHAELPSDSAFSHSRCHASHGVADVKPQPRGLQLFKFLMIACEFLDLSVCAF